MKQYLQYKLTPLNPSAVQNERDRISVRRTSYEDVNQTNSLSVSTLLNAEILSRQVSVYFIYISLDWMSDVLKLFLTLELGYLHKKKSTIYFARAINQMWKPKLQNQKKKSLIILTNLWLVISFLVELFSFKKLTIQGLTCYNSSCRWRLRRLALISPISWWPQLTMCASPWSSSSWYWWSGPSTYLASVSSPLTTR